MFRISGHFDDNTILCSNHSEEQHTHGVGKLLTCPPSHYKVIHQIDLNEEYYGNEPLLLEITHE